MNLNPATWPALGKLVGIVAAAGVVVGGGTAVFVADNPIYVGHHQSPSAPSAPPPSDICTIYAQQHDAVIVVSPGDQSQCGELIKDLSGGDAFWSYTPSGVVAVNLQQACDMTTPGGSYEAVVLDDNGGFIGQDVCSGMAQAGWTTSPSPGPLAQQIGQLRNQQQQAQVSASAAQASASASADAESLAQDHVNTLSQDANPLAGDVGQLGKDVGTTDQDLAQTRTDAIGGNGDQCNNATTTVYNDAATTVYNDVLTTVYNDANTSLVNDIMALRTDIGTVQSDQSALSGNGLPGTPGAGSAISAAQSAISSAIGTANADIDHANGDLSAAYAIANAVGTGQCAGSGPGQVPSGVSHLK